jgi:hypothetical protein
VVEKDLLKIRASHFINFWSIEPIHTSNYTNQVAQEIHGVKKQHKHDQHTTPEPTQPRILEENEHLNEVFEVGKLCEYDGQPINQHS